MSDEITDFYQLGRDSDETLIQHARVRLGWKQRLQVLLTGEITATTRTAIDMERDEFSPKNYLRATKAITRWGTHWPCDGWRPRRNQFGVAPVESPAAAPKEE